MQLPRQATSYSGMGHANRCAKNLCQLGNLTTACCQYRMPAGGTLLFSFSIQTSSPLMNLRPRWRLLYPSVFYLLFMIGQLIVKLFNLLSIEPIGLINLDFSKIFL